MERGSSSPRASRIVVSTLHALHRLNSITLTSAHRSYLLLDTLRNLATGDHLTPSTGTYAGQPCPPPAILRAYILETADHLAHGNSYPNQKSLDASTG